MVLPALPGPGTAAAGKSVPARALLGFAAPPFSAPETHELVLHDGEIMSGEKTLSAARGFADSMLLSTIA